MKRTNQVEASGQLVVKEFTEAEKGDKFMEYTARGQWAGQQRRDRLAGGSGKGLYRYRVE